MTWPIFAIPKEATPRASKRRKLLFVKMRASIFRSIFVSYPNQHSFIRRPIKLDEKQPENINFPKWVVATSTSHEIKATRPENLLFHFFLVTRVPFKNDTSHFPRDEFPLSKDIKVRCSKGWLIQNAIPLLHVYQLIITQNIEIKKWKMRKLEWEWLERITFLRL